MEQAQQGQLSVVGGAIHFIVQRILYLRQHPDARPGQPFMWSNDVALGTALLTGALLDLFLDTLDGTLPVGNALGTRLTDSGIEIKLAIKRDPDASRPGYQLMAQLASSIHQLESDDRCLIINITGSSVEAGFPKGPETGCPPVVAR
jgi:hypothetical protein